MDKDTVLAAIDKAFGHLSRPQAMVRNPNHCDECADHEAVMQAVTPQTVSLQEVGSPAWDPVCFLSDEAFCYFMPGLARLSLNSGQDYYLSQFLFHLEQGFRIDPMNAEQRRALAQLIDYIGETMLDEVINNMDDHGLARVMDLLAESEDES
ncbi:MAG: hypothetical protein K8L99_02075 [Anaerolineae bacterium]|nr:hypothetical protein [Anaerolineae bacterium]